LTDALRYCRALGIITGSSPISFANPVYREIITRILNSSLQQCIDSDLAQTASYLHPDGSLDMDKLLAAFIDFYRWNSESWLERFQYKEAGHQGLLMAFLQRIINGGGRIEREMAVGGFVGDVARELLAQDADILKSLLLNQLNCFKIYQLYM
jgi:hypothetical protein